MQAVKPFCPNRKPIEMKIQEGKTYWWCSCGKSQNQPLCDGSHMGTKFVPIKYQPVPGEKIAVFCQCKRSENKPLCDGTHSNGKLDW